MLFFEYYETANIEQHNFIDQVIPEILYNDPGSNIFCLTTHAGFGQNIHLNSNCSQIKFA